ncbi:hypothetical protein [Candidatus Accumulibacter sp. ACC003]|uniref:hypothetical protein n=1 Tax=Candidatus Accumulibacter sp. ACC003 TaxID=2823334 RepID=UPI0025C20B0A|nr:hypothetical protein [Candidatus Accumulibacter sp. ACC003]
MIVVDVAHGSFHAGDATMTAEVRVLDQKVSALDRRDRSPGEKVSRVGKNHPRGHRRDRRIDGGDGTIDAAHRFLSMSHMDRSMRATQR